MSRKLTHTFEFWFGDRVWLRCELDDPSPGYIVGISIRPECSVVYGVTWSSTNTTYHYDFELSREQPLGFDTPSADKPDHKGDTP